MPAYDMLHSPDFLVADADAMVRRLVERAGLPGPDPEWTQEFAGHGYRAVFARVHRSRAYAPTRLEVVAARPVPEPADPAIPRAYVEDYARIQGVRPLKTHATVFTTSGIEGLIERGRQAWAAPPGGPRDPGTAAPEALARSHGRGARRLPAGRRRRALLRGDPDPGPAPANLRRRAGGKGGGPPPPWHPVRGAARRETAAARRRGRGPARVRRCRLSR